MTLLRQEKLALKSRCSSSKLFIFSRYDDLTAKRGLVLLLNSTLCKVILNEIFEGGSLLWRLPFFSAWCLIRAFWHRIENAYTNGHYNPDLESEQGLGNGTVEVSTKKTEKNKKQKQDSVDQKDVSGSFVKIGPNNIVPNGEAEELVIDTPDNRNEGKKGKKKKSSKKKTAPSGPSNAEEAQAMRGVLGKSLSYISTKSKTRLYDWVWCHHWFSDKLICLLLTRLFLFIELPSYANE